MSFRVTSLALSASLLVTPAFAGPSGQHSAQSVGHSAQAASHGLAAISTGAASVAAVPIFAFGSALAVSGTTLEEVGEGAVALGNDLSRAGVGKPVQTGRVTPNAAPVLD